MPLDDPSTGTNVLWCCPELFCLISAVNSDLLCSPSRSVFIAERVGMRRWCISQRRNLMYVFVSASYSIPGKLKQFVLDLHSGKLHREFHHGPDPTESTPGQVSISTLSVSLISFTSFLLSCQVRWYILTDWYHFYICMLNTALQPAAT